MSNDSDGYTKIKNKLIISSKLDDLEYRILSYMLSIQKDGSCFPSIRRMAELFSTEDGKPRSTTTITKKIKSLEFKGFIKKKNRTLGSGKKTSNEYLISEDVISRNTRKPKEEMDYERLKEENKELHSRLEQAVSDYDWLDG